MEIGNIEYKNYFPILNQKMKLLCLLYFSLRFTVAFQSPSLCSIRLSNSPGIIIRGGSVARLHDTSVASNSLTFDDAKSRSEASLAQVDLARRTAICGMSCATTWLMIKNFGLSAIQASSVHGIVASLVLPGPMAAASLCGSFAGMSGQIATWADSLLLGAFAAFMYFVWESGKKLQLGKGGRLGTIAFLGNMMYYSFKTGNSITRPFVQAINLIRPEVAVIVASSSVLLAIARTKKLGKEQTTLLETACKFAALLALGTRLLGGYATVSARDAACTALAMFGASAIVKKSPGVVFPVGVVGLVGSFMGKLAAPIYLGAFLGMTSLTGFGMLKLLQSSIFSSILFHFGIFDGFGGKLGLLAFLAVNFVM